MAAVNSYDDIPAGINDMGTCYQFAVTVRDRMVTLNDIIPSANALKQLVDVCNNYAKDSLASAEQAKSDFENDAWYDGVHDYTEDLAEIVDKYTNVTADLDALSTDLETLISELNSDLTFCDDRQETWDNAGDFLFRIQQEQERAAMQCND